MTDPPVRGLRAEMRAALYQNQRKELGCPGEDACLLFKERQEEACAGCSKCLKPVERFPNPTAMRRLGFLTRIESLVNVGCHFTPDDLPMQVWDELVTLALERQRMDRLVWEQKDKERQKDRGAEERIAKLRKETGVPPPGGSIFPRKG